MINYNANLLLYEPPSVDSLVDCCQPRQQPRKPLLRPVVSNPKRHRLPLPNHVVLGIDCGVAQFPMQSGDELPVSSPPSLVGLFRTNRVLEDQFLNRGLLGRSGRVTKQS